MRDVDSVRKPPGRRWLRWLLDRLFGYESMSGAGACPVYLERWIIFSEFLGCGLYLHHFVGDDWALDPHDHPRRFVSIGLWGWYDEELYDATKSPLPVSVERFSAPWLRSFPAEHTHRIRAAEHGNVWTLVLVLPKYRPWGFIRDGVWIPWKKYTFGGDARKGANCK